MSEESGIIEAGLNTEPEEPKATLSEHVSFLLEVCHVAMETGCSSNRVELLVRLLGETWAINLDVAALPTAVWISARRDGQQIMELVRVRTWRVDLEKLSALNDLVDALTCASISLKEAHTKLTQILKQKPPYPAPLNIVAGATASLVITFFNNGSSLEMVLALPLGAIVQTRTRLLASESRRYLADFLTSMVVGIYVLTAKEFFPDINLARMFVAGLINLVPGLVFVNALHEIAQKNLSSGSARLVEATMIAFSLAFGVAAVMGMYNFFMR
jgi:uncharacterized membrane protein YjjP (DUF1212 family)